MRRHIENITQLFAIKICAERVRNAKLRNYLKNLFSFLHVKSIMDEEIFRKNQ